MKKVSIALIELHSHTEVLSAFLHTLQGFDLRIFASSAFNPEDMLPGYEQNMPVFICSPKQSNSEFIAQYKLMLDSFDWLIFITLEKHFSFFARQSWRAKTILVIHNGNYWLDYQMSLSLNSLKNILRWAKSVVLRQE